jgi:regulator of sigma E protease
MIVSIVAAVLIFATLIIVHEAGHFLMAKRLGVRVLRFSVGYPPRVWGFRRGETDYAIGATPLGGYVRMLGDEIGEDPSIETLKTYLKEIELDVIGAAQSSGWFKSKVTDDDETFLEIVHAVTGEADRPLAATRDGAAIAEDARLEPIRMNKVLGREPKTDEAILIRDVERTGSAKVAIESLAEKKPVALIEAFNERAFPSQRLGKRIAIVLAGPMANILFAPLLLALVFAYGVPVLLPVLGTVKADLPGYAAGLKPGDKVVAVNNKAIETWDELSSAVKDSNGHPLRLKVQRDEGSGAAANASAINIQIQPKQMLEETVYGNKAQTWLIGVTPRGDEATKRLSPQRALVSGFVETGHMAVTLFQGIAKIIEGVTPARQALGGPIMIAQMAGREAHQGFAEVGLFMVMLSLELGVINLLPVPLLDGGHLAFFVFEGIRGKPLQLRHREIAMQVGLFLLVILMAFVILNDISRIIG